MALLLERWAQSQVGLGQVVLLSGEAGIGKSRLVEVLRQLGLAAHYVAPFAVSHQSALDPVIQHLQRVLDWGRDETPAPTLNKLERMLQASGPTPGMAVPLVTALLAVPIPEGHYPPLWLTPLQQR